MFECVINISEGRNSQLLRDLSATAERSLRDLHRDEDHNRSVFTLINTPDELLADAHSLIGASFERLDLQIHEGAHPRFGVVDVIPFVALDESHRDRAIDLRDRTAQWIGNELGVPVFLYGPYGGTIRTLPTVRKGAFREFPPDFGPPEPSPRLGACALGARSILVAWNLWLHGTTLEEARRVASALRTPQVRALAFSLGEQVQISCNLIAPKEVGLAIVYDEVAGMLREGEISRAELVGLLPRDVLEQQDRSRWSQLGLSDERTIEHRLAATR